jgi:hypothetical protein
LLTNKEIVSQYFRLLQNKDIDSLKDLFWSDATVYEPFSKLEHRLRGWSQIEPFLKVAIMANESLSNKIAFEESRRIKNKDLNDEEKNTSDSNNDIVEALVTFQKDNVIKAKFSFELSNQANTVDGSERKKIKALRIQFT